MLILLHMLNASTDLPWMCRKVSMYVSANPSKVARQ
jgi:hypothetical protein